MSMLAVNPTYTYFKTCNFPINFMEITCTQLQKCSKHVYVCSLRRGFLVTSSLRTKMMPFYIIVLATVFLFWWIKNSSKPTRFPPGPDRYPVIGSALYMKGDSGTPNLFYGVRRGRDKCQITFRANSQRVGVCW